MEHIGSVLARAASKLDRRRDRPTISATLEDGTLLELVYHPQAKETALVAWKGGTWELLREVVLPDGAKLIPYSARNNLISHGVVLLPSGPEEYASEAALVSSIEAFIHRYVDVSPLFERVASYYVLLSWLSDAFNELPYLRVRGAPGSGKTRFLLVVGSLCQKPIFASGASTTSPLFRMLDLIKGTLVIDESDFRFSDEKAELVKILNNGNVRGFPVLRAECNAFTKEYNPTAYQVFGPKLVATRGSFDDRALESRFLTEEMGARSLRDEIPINLPAGAPAEALHLRNQLLLFRFRNIQKPRALEDLVDRSIEPRLNQIFTPLLSVIEDPQARSDLQDLARRSHRQLIADWGLELEAQLLEVIRGLWEQTGTSPTVKEITEAFRQRHGEDYGEKVTPKWIGSLVRRKLGLATERREGGYAIGGAERARLERLAERYGVAATTEDPPTPGSTASSGSSSVPY
jgi:hypothetical protein